MVRRGGDTSTPAAPPKESDADAATAPAEPQAEEAEDSEAALERQRQARRERALQKQQALQARGESSTEGETVRSPPASGPCLRVSVCCVNVGDLLLRVSDQIPSL